MLLLACGGSDEPTDRPSSERPTAEPTDLPDSERATGEPLSRASSGQTTTVPTTEGAEPSPTPRATARPPLAQTSPETDRETLIALYNATDGPNWKSNDRWLTDFQIGEWKGVGTDDNGRVTTLSFGPNQMSGDIPPELGNLASLTWLVLDENGLTGEIPPELAKLGNLEYLDIRETRLTGCVPNGLRDQLGESSKGLARLPYCP